MRKLTFGIAATVSAAVMVLSYRTSLEGEPLTAVGGKLALPRPGTSEGPGASETPGPYADSRDEGGPHGDPYPDPSLPAVEISPDAGASSSTEPAGPLLADDRLSVRVGAVAETEWGTVQVRVTFVGGRITDISPVMLPDSFAESRDINAYIVTPLRMQVLVAQSAEIDGVTGATSTSEAYQLSLQAALDAEHAR